MNGAALNTLTYQNNQEMKQNIILHWKSFSKFIAIINHPLVKLGTLTFVTLWVNVIGKSVDILLILWMINVVSLHLGWIVDCSLVFYWNVVSGLYIKLIQNIPSCSYAYAKREILIFIWMDFTYIHSNSTFLSNNSPVNIISLITAKQATVENI